MVNAKSAVPDLHVSDEDAPAPRFPWRALIIALLLIPLLVFWVEYTEIVSRGADLAAMSLPMASTFALLVLIVLNALFMWVTPVAARIAGIFSGWLGRRSPNALGRLALVPINAVIGLNRLAPRIMLTQGELILVYCMTTIAVYISGIGIVQFLNAQLVGWSYFATPENRWDQWFPLLRSWSLPDVSVVKDYYSGGSSLFANGHIQGWLRAIVVWSLFLLVLMFSLYCIATLVRKQWVENERLMFPIVQIPLEITRDGGLAALWSSRLFWLGFVIPVVFESLATLHTLFPPIPYFPIKPEPALELGHYLTIPPWNAVGYLTLSFYPLVIGLTYLLSLDVSFSCWFFYLFTKAEGVFCASAGLRDAGPNAAQPPYIIEQGFGAFIGLAVFSIWLGRRHVADVWRAAFMGDKTIDDSPEPLSYRTAFVGLFASSALLIAFGVALGMSPLVALVFFGLYLVLALAFTRIRAEAGLPWGQGPWGLSHGNMVNMAGTQAFSHQELASLSMMNWIDSDWRCMPQTIQIEAMKMADAMGRRRLSMRHLSIALLCAVIVGTIAAWTSCLGIYYHFGAASAHVDAWRTWVGRWPFDTLQNQLISQPKPTDWHRIFAAGGGAFATLLLGAMRTHFVWWPFNPIGYAVANTDTMTWIWFSVAIGWFVKTLMLRFGGVKAFRQGLPFFLGLVLGDYAISGLWSLFFLATGHPGYRTFPI